MLGGDPHKAWVEEHPAVIEYAFGRFMESGEWPAIALLRRHFASQGYRFDAQAYADSKPRRDGQFTGPNVDALRLNIRQLRYLPSASRLIDVCLVATRLAVAAYLSPDAELQITSDDPRISSAAEGDAQLISRAGGLLFTEQPGPTGGGNPPGPDHPSWMFHINESCIQDFENVDSAARYVAAQDAVLDRDARNLQAWIGPPATAEPARIFVVMPFTEEWSEAVHRAIRATVDDWLDEPKPQIVRVDQVRRAGRVSLQVLDEIRAADIVVADITDRNGNVMYEVGWAHALGKPTILLNQDVEDSPFDIQDYRQLLYNPEALSSLTDELALFLDAEIAALAQD